jgi:chemotaxis protein MotB
MATESQDKAPIIVIKKIKKGGHGAHGGAWKIAYADFVTAMMAFFLLMWLLGSTSEGDLKGISEFFNSPLKVAMLGGSGAGDATALIKGGGTNLSKSTGQEMRGGKPDKNVSLETAKEKVAQDEAKKLNKLKSEIEAMVDASTEMRQFKNQIRLDITQEGLRIQIVDEKNRPMFDSGSAVLKGYMRDILVQIARLLNEVDNKITLSGHTDSQPYAMGERGYSNWELSADRANASRREMTMAGLEDRKMLRVVGLASSVPLVKEDPMHPTNRRIAITVMNKRAEEAVVTQSLPGEADTAVSDSDKAAENRR